MKIKASDKGLQIDAAGASRLNPDVLHQAISIIEKDIT